MLYRRKKVILLIGMIVCYLAIAIAGITTKAGKLTIKRENATSDIVDIMEEIKLERTLIFDNVAYLSQRLKLNPLNIVTAGFNLPDDLFSGIYNGTLGVKGFPAIHPYNSFQSDFNHFIFMANLQPTYTYLPPSVAKDLTDNIKDIKDTKLVIMPLKEKEPLLYRPHYMVFPQGSAETTLSVTIRGCDFAKPHFKNHKGVEDYLPFTFSTHLNTDHNMLVASPDNAEIVFEAEDGNSINISEVKSGSFWVIHRNDQNHKAITLFWVLNDKQLHSELNSFFHKPDQTLLDLLGLIQDEGKWGHPARVLHKMMGIKTSFSRQKYLKWRVEQINSETVDEYDGAILTKSSTNDSSVSSTKADDDLYEDSSDEESSVPDKKYSDFMHDALVGVSYEQEMKKKGFIHQPTEEDGRCIYKAMTNTVYYNHALTAQKAACNFQNEHEIIANMSNSLKFLRTKIKDDGRLAEEVKKLLKIERIDEELDETIGQMIECFDHVFTTNDVLPKKYWGNTKMFGLLGLLNNLEIRRYDYSAKMKSPVNLYSVPEEEYPTIRAVLKDYILPSDGTDKLHSYVIACYPSDGKTIHCDNWLTPWQALTIKEKLGKWVDNLCSQYPFDSTAIADDN